MIIRPAFLGAAGSENNTLLVNMGTGGQISVLDRSVILRRRESKRVHFFGGKYLLVGASLCGGKAYALLEKFFQVIYEGGNRTGYTIV